MPRVNIAPVSALNGLLNQEILNDAGNITIFHVGENIGGNFTRKIQSPEVVEFFKNSKVFQEKVEEPI